jgi:hypothetical protein
MASHMQRARARLSPPFDVSLVEKNEVSLYMRIVPKMQAPGDVDSEVSSPLTIAPS